MIRLRPGALLLGTLFVAFAAAPAHAALTICNRTSYLMDLAVGLEKQPAVATRGWFRVDPGQCKKVIEDTAGADLVYLHARTPPVYGNAPLPQGGDAELCVRDKDFAIANARNCPVSEQMRFAAARPADGADGPTVNLAEEGDYDNAQARLAGIQRLLSIAGYDARPIDGVDGTKTHNALAKFLKDHKLPVDAFTGAGFFDTLLAAARNPQGAGFAWCNDTRYTVMAALGVVEMGSIVARGWYHIAAGQCLRPELANDPHRIYSYGEAVDDDGRTVKRGDKPLAWGGNVMLCTRDGKFELSDHKDCAARSLTATGFVAVEIGGQQSMTVRFKEP